MAIRDLAARLRSIVKEDVRRVRAGSGGVDAVDISGVHYEPDVLGAALEARDVARILHGEVRGPSCVMVDRTWDATDWHGRRRVDSYALDEALPLAMFDARLSAETGWASRVVFFDIETTGLSGGAGTLAFLVGCGWFEDGGFKVRQFFLSGPAGEHAMLDALAGIFDDASLLVTFNGRTFDVPFMEMRWAFHRRACATSDLPHFDMLPPARKLWSRREPDDERASCTLSALERSVLRFHRLGDVPGFEIPARYFHFLRSGDPGVIEGVLEHNRHDLISLAALTSRALQLAVDGPEACESAGEQLGLARVYELSGDEGRAIRAYELAASSTDREVATRALSRLAVFFRREGRFGESAAAWERVLERTGHAHRPLTSLERRAVEALAIHHEHRARDLDEARRYAEALRAEASGQLVVEVNRRLGRIERKMRAADSRKGSPAAAPLLD